MAICIGSLKACNSQEQQAESAIKLGGHTRLTPIGQPASFGAA
jgi:hypothetical protein